MDAIHVMQQNFVNGDFENLSWSHFQFLSVQVNIQTAYILCLLDRASLW